MMNNINHLQNLYEVCYKEKINGYLVALDASKAFDSIDHEFMMKVLKKFGFGGNFIASFKTLYSNLKASLMINGNIGERFDILKGVKQGDALSCVIFILCMEMLIRKIEQDDRIKGVKLLDPRTSKSTNTKVMVYADDITPIVQDHLSIQYVFDNYLEFTACSGIKLNHDKTEIFKLGEP